MWTRLGVFGLGEGDTVPLGVAIGVVFFAAALAVAGPLTLGEGAVYGVALLAPATMLGVERGNVDLLMFALVVLGLLLLRRSPWAGAAPIVLAGGAEALSGVRARAVRPPAPPLGRRCSPPSSCSASTES